MINIVKDWRYQVLARLAFRMLKPWMVQQYKNDGDVLSIEEIMADVIVENTGIPFDVYLNQVRGDWSVNK